MKILFIILHLSIIQFVINHENYNVPKVSATISDELIDRPLIVGTLCFMENEVWVNIPSYEGLYEASNLGNIRSVARIINGRNKPSVVLSPCLRNDYLRVRLFKDNGAKMFVVHRLVMLSFVGESKLTVDHINGKKNDNRLSNLRYCSHRNNCIYARSKMEHSSKYVGVSWDKRRKNWRAVIHINNKFFQLGAFNSEEAAKAAYDNKLLQLKEG